MVHYYTFPKAAVPMDVNPGEAVNYVKPSDVKDDVKLVYVKVDIKRLRSR